MRRSSWGQMVTSCSSWLGTFHSSRQMYVVVASHLLVPFTRRPDLSHFQPDEPTLSLPSRIYTGGLEIAKVRTSTFLCVFISLNTISAVRRMVSRNAHALALGRRLRQGSIGTRRWNAALPRVRPGKYFFSLRCLQAFHTHSRVQLVSQSFRFFSTAIRSGAYRDIFEAPNIIRGLIAGVVKC